MDKELKLLEHVKLYFIQHVEELRAGKIDFKVIKKYKIITEALKLLLLDSSDVEILKLEKLFNKIAKRKLKDIKETM